MFFFWGGGWFRPVTSIIMVDFRMVIMVMKLFKNKSKQTSDISWFKESVFVLRKSALMCLGATFWFVLV